MNGCRRAYVFSDALTNGVRTYAATARMSEAAAIRQLLTEALDQRESGCALQTRAHVIVTKFGVAEALSVLAKHPQVVAIAKDDEGSRINCRDGHHFTIVEIPHG